MQVLRECSDINQTARMQARGLRALHVRLAVVNEESFRAARRPVAEAAEISLRSRLDRPERRACMNASTLAFAPNRSP
jgi:hypothetical protein